MEKTYINYKVVRELIRTTKRIITNEVLAESEEQAKKIVADKIQNEMNYVCDFSDRERSMNDILLNISEKIIITPQK